MNKKKIEPKLKRIRQMIVDYKDIFDLMPQDVNKPHLQIRGNDDNMEISSQSIPVEKFLDAKFRQILNNYIDRI